MSQLEGDTPVTTWTSSELDKIGTASELQMSWRSHPCDARVPCATR